MCLLYKTCIIFVILLSFDYILFYYHSKLGSLYFPFQHKRIITLFLFRKARISIKRCMYIYSLKVCSQSNYWNLLYFQKSEPTKSIRRTLATLWRRTSAISPCWSENRSNVSHAPNENCFVDRIYSKIYKDLTCGS